MCWKYKNKNEYVFVWCEIANNKAGGASYLRGFKDMIGDYYSNYNYCPYCGSELKERER